MDSAHNNQVSDRCKEWLRTHSPVEAVNVAAVKQSLPDITLALEIQSYVHSTIGKDMCEMAWPTVNELADVIRQCWRAK